MIAQELSSFERLVCDEIVTLNYLRCSSFIF